MHYKITRSCSAFGIHLPTFLGQTRIIFSSGIKSDFGGIIHFYYYQFCYSLWCLNHILFSNCRKLYLRSYSFHQVGERVGWSLMKSLRFEYSRDFVYIYIHQTYVGVFLLSVAFQYFKLDIYYGMYLGSFSLMFTLSYLYLLQLELNGNRIKINFTNDNNQKSQEGLNAIGI